MPYLLFAMICALWGSNFMLMKRAVVMFGPTTVGGLRALGGLLALALLWRFTKLDSKLRRKHLGPMALIVVVGYAWPYAIQPYLVRQHGGGFVGMTVSLVPLLTILVSIPMLKIVPRWWQTLGVLGGLGCMALLLRDGLNREIPLTDLLLAASVPTAYAITNSYTRLRLPEVNPLPLACLTLMGTAAALLPLGAATESVAMEGNWAGPIACVAWLGLIGTGLANYWFTILLQKQGPLFAGMVTYLVPIGAVVWGWLDQEQVTPTQIAALAGIFAMVGLVQFRAGRPATSIAPSKRG